MVYHAESAMTPKMGYIQSSEIYSFVESAEET